MNNLQPIVFDATYGAPRQAVSGDTVALKKVDGNAYPLITTMPRFAVVEENSILPTIDGYYLFAGEPAGGLPHGVDEVGGIAELRSATWSTVFNINQIPDVAIEYDGGSWVRNPAATGWMPYKQIDDTRTNNYTLWSGLHIITLINEAFLNTPSLPAVQFATIANDSLTGLAARDGYTPVAGNIALVKNQTNNDNGFRIVTSTGTWTRAKFNDVTNVFEAVTTETTYEQLDMQNGVVNVLNGTNNKNAQFQIIIQNPKAVFGDSVVYVNSTTKQPIVSSNTRYIDPGSGNNSFKSAGSSAFPFATLAAAYNSAGLSFPAIFFMPPSGAPLTDSLTHTAGKSNLAIITLDHTRKGGKSAMIGVQTFATGNTRITFKGQAFSTGSSTPMVFQTGNLYRHEFEDVSFSGTYTNLMSIAADASNWLTFRNCDFTSAPLATLALPSFTGAFIINIHNQSSRFPISGSGASSTMINIYSSEEGIVRVFPSYIGKINWAGKTFGYPLGSAMLANGLVTTQSQLDAILAWTTNTNYDGYHAISGFNPTSGQFANGAIFGKQTAPGVGTEVFWGRDYLQAPGIISSLDGTVYRQAGSGRWVSIGQSPVSGAVIDNTINDSSKITIIGTYIVPSDGLLNDFIGKANKLAKWDGQTFAYSSPVDGAQVLINSGFNVGQVWTYTAINASWSRSSVEPPTVVGVGSPTNSIGLIYDGSLYTAQSNVSSWSYWSGLGLSVNEPRVQGMDNFNAVHMPKSIVVSAQLGYGLSWVLTSNGNLYTWGQNNYGQCGTGSTTPVPRPTIIATGVAQVYGDSSNSGRGAPEQGRLVFSKTDGSLWGCGYQNYGQLANSQPSTSSSVPLQILPSGSFPKYVANLGSTLGCLFVQTSDNKIYATGYNGAGSLGTGSTASLSSLTDVTSAWNNGDTTMVVRDIVGGFGYFDGNYANHCWVAMLLSNGSTTVLKTCGSNVYGMLGDGTTTSRNTPISPNVGAGNIIQIASIGGGAGNLFVLKASGDLYGCGYNGYGMLGVGDTLQKNTPIIINTGVAKILRPNYATASFEHWTQAFIKKSDGTYFAAGKNDYGECGVGSTSNSISTWTKMPFPDKTNIIDIYSYVASASACIAMAVTDDGRIYGWGHGTDRGVLSSMTAPIRSPIKINFTK